MIALVMIALVNITWGRWSAYDLSFVVFINLGLSLIDQVHMKVGVWGCLLNSLSDDKIRFG